MLIGKTPDHSWTVSVPFFTKDSRDIKGVCICQCLCEYLVLLWKRNGTLWKRNFWYPMWKHSSYYDVIQSRKVLVCLQSFCTFCSMLALSKGKQCMNLIYFLHFMLSLIFIDMQMSYNNDTIYMKTVLILQETY